MNGLARLHGGELVIDSKLGEGTTVTVKFPAERAITKQRAGLLAPQLSATRSQRRLMALTA